MLQRWVLGSKVNFPLFRWFGSSKTQLFAVLFHFPLESSKGDQLHANKASIGQLNSQPIRNILKSHEVAGASALMHATLNIGQPGLDLALNVFILLLMSPSSF